MEIFVKRSDKNLPNFDIFGILNTKRTISKSTIKICLLIQKQKIKKEENDEKIFKKIFLEKKD